MQKNRNFKIFSGVVLVVIIILTIFYTRNSNQNSPILVASAFYYCDSGKNITANYFDIKIKPTVVPGNLPIPTGSVSITLSDGREMNLVQTISADGGRYVNKDDSIIFWNKGNGVIFLENNKQTFVGCLAVAKDPGGLPLIYKNDTKGFSIRYPNDFTLDEKYLYQALGPGKDIGGVRFIIPQSLSKGTNLGSDSYVSVEQIPRTQICTAEKFTYQGVKSKQVVDNGQIYSYASSTDAGLGNRYEESIYAIPGTNPCVAIRYFVHYSVFENYPVGMVREFDRQSILKQFDKIRRTLILN